MKDKINNHALSVKNFLMHALKIKPKSPFNTDLGVTHHFDEMGMEEFLSLYNPSQYYGDYHPGDLKMWYDKTAVKTTKWGLECSVNESLFRIPDSDENGNGGKYIKIGVGLCLSKQTYHFGLFEWNITLPIGAQLWPAIWLSGSISWPPEIDVLEAYSDDNCKYGNRLNSNLYYREYSNTKKDVKAMSHGNLVDINKTLNLKLDWQKDHVKIYYNNFLVRCIKDKEVLASIGSEPMVVIMNNGVRKPNVGGDSKSPLIVQDFTYLSNS